MDNTVLLSLLLVPARDHGLIVSEFVEWCDSSCLEVNATETKEIFLDFPEHGEGRIHNSEVITKSSNSVKKIPWGGKRYNSFYNSFNENTRTISFICWLYSL